MKILIVEDEPKVRRALKRLLLEIDPQIERILEAEDGESALQLLNDKPDMLLLDMIMPGMRGDELFDRIRAMNWDLPVVVVSGHHDFAFVRQAVANDAIDYILKPFDKNDIEQAYTKAKAFIEEKRFRSKTEQLLDEMQSRQFRLKLQNALRHVAQGRIDGEVLELLPGFVREERCRLHVLVICNYEEALNDRFRKDAELLDYALIKIIQEYAELNGVELLAGSSAQFDWCRWIAVRPADNAFEPERLVSILQTVLKLQCFVLSETAHTAVEDYAEVIAALESKVFYANLNERHHPSIIQPKDWTEFIDLFVGKAVHAVRHGLAFRIEEDIDELLYQASEANQLCIMLLFQIWMSLKNRLEINEAGRSGKNKFLDSAEAVALHIAFESPRIKTLFKETIEQLIASGASRADLTRPGDDRALAVKEYIDIAYHTPLSLANLARRFYISKEYLASRFKQQFGMTVVQYIHEVRLREAHRLLTDSSRSISEIAVSAGYDHFSYFTKRFKEKYGLTPSEYRAMSKNGAED